MRLISGIKVRVEDVRPDTLVPRGVHSEEALGDMEKRKRAKKDGDGDRGKAKKKQGERCGRWY